MSINNNNNNNNNSSLSPVYHRLNFLLQIGQIYSNLSSKFSRSCYNHSRILSKKKLARIDSSYKHKWCNNCYSHLIIGKTSNILIENDELISKMEYNLDNSKIKSSLKSIKVLTKCLYCNKNKIIFF